MSSRAADTPETPQRTTAPTTAEERQALRKRLCSWITRLLDDVDALTAELAAVRTERQAARAMRDKAGAERDAAVARAQEEGALHRQRLEALYAAEAERDRLARENAALREAIREDPTRWSFDTLTLVARHLLDEVYPAHVFTGVSGDPGAVFVVALRDALAALTPKPEEPESA